MSRIPSLKLLMGFEAAARLGSFARAADELCLSHSAISHQIQQLEEQTGQALFRRVGRGVELTMAGELLQRTVQRSLETLRSGLGRIATYLDPGLVVLVCPAPLLHGWLQPQLAQLQQDLPGVCPLLSTDETARYVDEIDVDITIGSRPIQQPDLLELPLLQDEWLLVARQDIAHKLHGSPVTEHPLHCPLICLEEHLTGEQTGPLFRQWLQSFRMAAIYDDQRCVLDAVERGRGMALVSKLAALDGLQNGRLVVVNGYPVLPGPHWWLSRVAGEPRSTRVSQVFDWLLAQAARQSRT